MRSPEWQAEVDEYEERIRQLREELEPPELYQKVRVAFGLYPGEARVLTAVLVHGWRSHDQLKSALWRDQEEEPESRVAAVHLTRARKKLGWDPIQSVHGYGYRMPEADRKRIMAIIAD